jgi:PAS domain S-box-containing protein
MEETASRILVVEDEAIVALDIRTQLERLGYTVVGTAGTVPQACQMAVELQPDLVLMDIHLQSGGDGIDAAEAIRRGRAVPVVFLTAYADSETLARAKRVQPYGYIVKPFTEADLRTTIEIALHKGEIDRALQQSREDMLTLLDVQRHGTILVDGQGCVTFLSRAARRMLGKKTDDAIGQDWRDTLQPSPQENNQLLDSIRQASGRPRKVSVVRARDNKVSLHLEIEVQDDPRDPDQKIFFLYDVSDLHHLRRKLDESACYEGIVGKSDAIRRVVRLIEDLAQVDSTVLIEGESGTGKELVAKAIHQRSRRCDAPFLPLNCAGLSDELAASQLFGHQKGAFTGATEDRRGLFEAAGGGTLFLDEIGELPERVQTTLLRVLEENVVMRLGETKLRPVNPRIIVASNRDLASEAAQGRFRSDLLYRIRVARVLLPPLRERREDIPLLVHVFLAEQAAVTGKAVDAVSDAAMSALMEHDWPGNIRELKNALEFAVIRARQPTLQHEDLPDEVAQQKPTQTVADLGAFVDDEKGRILAALERCGGNRKAAAKMLGIGRATLYRRMAQLDMTDTS